MNPAKSVTELLRELEHPKEKNCLAPFLIFEDLTQKGLSGVWNETNNMEKALFEQFVCLRELEATTNKVEYAVYFWTRMRKRLQSKETPIGEEHE
jgi:hypothetical protein